jgi:hypothetical protein
MRFLRDWVLLSPLCLLVFLEAEKGHASGFRNDCSQLVHALLQANRSDRLVEAMLDPAAGKNEAFLGDRALPWIGYFFPFTKGGIVQRWNSVEAGRAPRLLDEGIEASSPGARREAVKARLGVMSAEEIHALSPAEKMDIFLGNYDFRISRVELETRGPRRDPTPDPWEGFCNGRCAAGMLHSEPLRAVKVTNADGIEVVFEPNDIKGLMSASYYYVEGYAQMGSPNRVLGQADLVDQANPAAFDMTLRAMLGEAERPFVVDIDPGPEIWNHLAVGYERRVSEAQQVSGSSELRPRSARFEMKVQSTVYYVNDIQDVAAHNRLTTDRIRRDNFPMVFSRPYPYTLYLDENHKIVGGSWHNTREMPDFAWFPSGRGTDADEGLNPHLPFDKVMELHRKSTSLE